MAPLTEPTLLHPPGAATRTSPAGVAQAAGRRSFHVVTLGCAKNSVDSEAMELLLLAAGHRRAAGPDGADVVVVNTCGFIESAKQESIDTLLVLGESKRPGQKLVATGCLVERYAGDLAAELPVVDGFVGARNWSALPGVVSRLDELRAPGSSLALVEIAPPGELDLEIMARRAAGPSAYVKVSDGCDQRCAFCAIPLMKGNHRSKPAELILREIGQLVEHGVKEVVLIGQDTTRYGHDLGERDGLAHLLEAITDRYPALPWIRVMYAYPRHIGERFLQVMRERPPVLPYLDVPLQHTHPWTLARMRRPHRDVDDLVGWMRDRVPGLVLRTTFIVGFPGETEDEFDHLVESVRRLRFSRVGVFAFSDEEGTASERLPDPVPAKVKEQRRRRLMAAAKQVTAQENARLVGQTLDVLIEGQPEEGSGWFAGRSYRDAPEVDGLVLVKAPSLAVGQMVPVEVERALAYDLLARPLDTPVGGEAAPTPPAGYARPSLAAV